MTELMKKIDFLDRNNIRYFVSFDQWATNVVIDMYGQTVMVIEYSLKGNEEAVYMVDHPEWEFSTWETYLAQNLYDNKGEMVI